MAVFAGHINRIQRNNMSGTLNKSLVLFFFLFQILFSELVICSANMNNETIHQSIKPIIYPIPLENMTIIPEEYKNLSVVGKCCPLGEVLVKNGTQNSVCYLDSSMAENFSPVFYGFNAFGYETPGEVRSSFVAIIGDPCKYKKYILNPNDDNRDNNYLLTNGSIYAPDHDPKMLQPGINYCAEIVPKLGLQTFVCFSESRVIITADSRITIYACGLLISVPFLILTIAAYSITPNLRDIFGRALCRYCGSLALAFMMLAITQLWNVELSDQACTSIAFVIQFSFVACFFWLNAICIEMWSLVRVYVDRGTYRRMKPRMLFFWYSLWCWGPSVILILVSMIMDLSPMIPATYVKPNSKKSCSFKSEDEAIPYFYIPIGLLLVANVILFVLIFVKLTKYQRDLDLRRLARNQESDRLDRKYLRRLMRTTFVCMIIFVLMGLNWTVEVIFWFVNGDSFDWSSFDLINALQGVLIFALFVLRRPPRDFVWHRIQELRGIHQVPELEAGSMELYLLPTINGDSLPR